jgi:hypothetical protein
MHIGVVDAALATFDDEFHDDAQTHKGVIVDRLHSVMNDKPSSKANSQPAPRGIASPRGQAGGTKTNPAFDAWLEGKLHNMFDAVAAEPLPSDLVKLLEQLDQKTRNEGKKDKP